MNHLTVGFAVTGSFCTLKRAMEQAQKLADSGCKVIPIASQNAYGLDTRFGPAGDFMAQLEAVCGTPVLHTLTQVEPIGPKKLLDALIVLPATGNTLAKLANGIADTPVTLACKAHLRNDRPLILGVSTNDGLAGNAANIGRLMAVKNVWFIPFGQDDCTGKETSLVADFDKMLPTLTAALAGRRLQPQLI